VCPRLWAPGENEGKKLLSFRSWSAARKKWCYKERFPDVRNRIHFNCFAEELACTYYCCNGIAREAEAVAASAAGDINYGGRRTCCIRSGDSRTDWTIFCFISACPGDVCCGRV